MTTLAVMAEPRHDARTLVKNKGQWNAKSGPKTAYGNFAMRNFFSGRLDSK